MGKIAISLEPYWKLPEDRLGVGLEGVVVEGCRGLDVHIVEANQKHLVYGTWLRLLPLISTSPHLGWPDLKYESKKRKCG